VFAAMRHSFAKCLRGVRNFEVDTGLAHARTARARVESLAMTKSARCVAYAVRAWVRADMYYRGAGLITVLSFQAEHVITAVGMGASLQ
jgi:hypothetical protein